MMTPTHSTFRFTRPIEEILKAGNSAQKELLTHLKEEFIKEQIIILLGGVGDEKSVEPIINAMISETGTKAVPNAEQINNTANLALTNITVADVIWHHGGGIVIKRCPDNPKECWSDCRSRNKTTFSVKGIKQSRRYSNYPNYGIYKNNA